MIIKHLPLSRRASAIIFIGSLVCVAALAQQPRQTMVSQYPLEPGTNVERKGQQTEPQRVTLFSRITYKETDYGKSAFNFRYGLRSDHENWEPVARNSAQLMYGSISFDPGTDWFSVSMGGDDPSRIKDLGELQWSEVYDIPILLASPRQSTGIRFPGLRESFEASSDERVTKVVAGHMYLVHIKNREADLYAMFRVEALEPSDHCTISWKVVPSPEK